MAGTRYVLLCRHGRHRDGVLVEETRADGSREHPIDLVGSRLKEQLEATDPPGRAQIRLASAWCAPSAEAQETAGRLVDVLRTEQAGVVEVRDDEISLREDLGPDAGGAGITWLLADLLSAVGKATRRDAVLVVGHQPQLSRIADELLRRRRRPWRPAPVPVDRAGIVCIASESGDIKDAWLVWAISYDHSAAAKEVREKVARKMDVAKLLGSLLVVGLTVIFGVLFDQGKRAGLGERQWAVQVTGALLLLAACCTSPRCTTTRCACQNGSGATRRSNDASVGGGRVGWPSARRARRPSCSINMMRIWRNLFTIASVVMIGATILLGYAALEVKPLILLGVGLPLGVITVWWLRWSRPLLGSED